MGGSGTDEGRDSWVTPEWLADVVSGDYEIDLDPCGNPRSYILAKRFCTLESGGDGLLASDPGSYLTEAGVPTERAGSGWRVFINPPYARNQVGRWVKHYRHTDFIFLLRWAPDTLWFGELWPHCWGAWFPKKCDVNPSGRINFEPPPGVHASSNPFPHALYLKSEPAGKLLDRLLATGYLVRNYARQESTRQGEGTNDAVGAGSRRARSNRARTTRRAGGTAGNLFGVDRTAAAQPEWRREYLGRWIDPEPAPLCPRCNDGRCDDCVATRNGWPTPPRPPTRQQEPFTIQTPAGQWRVASTSSDAVWAFPAGGSEGEELPF